jgi:hypothetical protein
MDDSETIVNIYDPNFLEELNHGKKIRIFYTQAVIVPKGIQFRFMDYPGKSDQCKITEQDIEDIVKKMVKKSIPKEIMQILIAGLDASGDSEMPFISFSTYFWSNDESPFAWRVDSWHSDICASIPGFYKAIEKCQEDIARLVNGIALSTLI